MLIKYIITLVFIIVINPTRCSVVHVALNQDSTHISKYCPKQRYCREGTHVVCMYYDQNHMFGPHCGNPVELEVTPKLEQKILANINDIRGEVATGKETGKGDEVLPRAYGLMKLITSAITPKMKDINPNYIHEAEAPVLKSSKPQVLKPMLESAPTANIFEDLIFKVRSYGEKKATTENILGIAEENIVGNVKYKTENVKTKSKQQHFAHKNLLTLLDSLEREVKNLKFDDDLKQIFDLKMRKIYETGVNKGEETSSPSAPDQKLKKKDPKAHLETNKSIENEIASLRRMIHRFSKGTQKGHKVTYDDEYENDQNKDNNFATQKYDAYYRTKYVNNIEDSYENILKKNTHTDHPDYHIIFNDILNGKHVDRHHYHTRNLQDNPESKNQDRYTNHNARKTILSKAIGYNLDNYDGEKMELERIRLQQQSEINDKNNINSEDRHVGNNKNGKSSERRPITVSNSRLQFGYPYSRKNKKGEIYQILVQRPSQIDSFRISIHQPRQSIFSGETESFTF